MSQRRSTKPASSNKKESRSTKIQNSDTVQTEHEVQVDPEEVHRWNTEQFVTYIYPKSLKQKDTVDDPNLFSSSNKNRRKASKITDEEEYLGEEMGQGATRKKSITSHEFIDTIYDRMVKQTLKTKEKIDRMRVEKIKEDRSLLKALPSTPANQRRSREFLNRMSDHVRHITDLSTQMEIDKLKRESEREREIKEMSECTFKPKINDKSSKIGSRRNSFGNSTDIVDRLHDWKAENLRNKLSLQAKLVEQEKKRGGSRSSRDNAPGSQSNFPESHYTDLGHFRSAQKISEDFPREQRV